MIIDSFEESLTSWVDTHYVEPLITLDRFDFHVARFMVDFLEVFYKATNALSGSYYCTSSLFFHNICIIIAQFAKYRDRDLLDLLIVSIGKKLLQCYKTLPLLPLLTLAMDHT